MTTDCRPLTPGSLPDGWHWANLGDLLSFVGSGITPRGGRKGYQAAGVPFIRSQNVYPDGLRLDGVARVSPELHETMSRTHVQSSDVLLNITGASIGRSTVVPEWLGPANVNQHVCILRTLPAIEPCYLSGFLNSSLGQKQIMDSQSGVTRQGLNYKQIRELAIPLAPLAEQRHIVAKTETLFQQSRRGQEALDAVPNLLAQFRQAVLSAAFRGELTERDPDDEPASVLLERIRAERRHKWEEDLRAKGKDPSRHKYEEPAPPDTSDLPELPEGWVWVSVEEMAMSIQYGYTAKSSPEFDGPHYLRITDIQNGTVDWPSVPNCEIEDDFLPKYLLKPGDIVFARSGATAGKSYLVTDCPIAVFASYLIRIQLFAQVLPEYLYAFFNSQGYWDQVITRGNAQPNANARVLGAIKFPLAPLAEQRRIVARIEALFVQADILEAQVAAVRRRLAQVDQAVLARAFRGELVPQDPDDEPASVLLERIRKEREAGATGEKKRKTQQIRLPTV